MDHDKTVAVCCTVVEGNGDCGKRQLRNEIRLAVAKELQTKSVFAYRNEEAAKMIDDYNDLGTLQNEEVLHKAKHEYRKAQYLDPDPVRALSILKRLTPVGQNVVHKIGYDPFFVHFWSSHQTKVYNEKMMENGAFLAIDATGSVAHNIVHVDGKHGKHLFLYTAVLNCTTGTLPVSRQISEVHDAASISDLFKKWLHCGAKLPTELVSEDTYTAINLTQEN